MREATGVYVTLIDEEGRGIRTVKIMLDDNAPPNLHPHESRRQLAHNLAVVQKENDNLHEIIAVLRNRLGETS